MLSCLVTPSWMQLTTCHATGSVLMMVSLAAYLDDSNTLGHLTGYILTSQPLTKGGLSPYDVVPTCFLQSADHLFHDEVCQIGPQPRS